MIFCWYLPCTDLGAREQVGLQSHANVQFSESRSKVWVLTIGGPYFAVRKGPLGSRQGPLDAPGEQATGKSFNFHAAISRVLSLSSWLPLQTEIGMYNQIKG